MARTEIKDFVIRAYRTVNEGDKSKFTNWQSASTVTLQLVVEIDGIEIPVAVETLGWASWNRQMTAWQERQSGKAPVPSASER